MTTSTTRHPLFRSAAARLLMATVAVACIGAASLPALAQPMGGMQHAMHGGMQHAMHGGMQGAMHGDMQGGMHRGGMGGGMPMMQLSDRMLDLVKATPEQRTQIRQIMESAHKDLQALREGGRSLRDEAMAIFAQPNVDARAAEALRQKQLAMHDQMSKRHLQAALDASRVLTPEQRSQLADTLKKRRQMMERHMQERRAMEAPKS